LEGAGGRKSRDGVRKVKALEEKRVKRKKK
jgi:hypothetical protein